VRRLAIGLLLALLVLGALIALSLAHPRSRAAWFVLEDHLVWRNPSVTRELETALADCSVREWKSVVPIAAMIIQDKGDPCDGDRLPLLLQPHLTAEGERMLLDYLERHRVSDAALERFVRAETISQKPIPDLAWRVLDAPETSPRLRYEIASDVLASDASDRDLALERLPRIHGIGTLVLFESFAEGDESFRGTVIDFLESPPPLRALPGDPDGTAFQHWIGDRTGAGLGLSLEDLSREITRAHTGLLPRDVPSELYGTLRSAMPGTCATVDARCRRLLARLLRLTHEEDVEPPAGLWPELGKGALTAWLVDGASEWVVRGASIEERSARILAVVAHPDHDGVGNDPVGALTWGAGTPGAVAALVGELSRRADVPVELSIMDDGGLHVAFPPLSSSVPTIGGAVRPGPLAHPADLARAEAIELALELGDLVRAQDLAAALEDPNTPWIAALVGELMVRTAPPPPTPKKKRRGH
jgi:hypothetical protein